MVMVPVSHGRDMPLFCYPQGHRSDSSCLTIIEHYFVGSFPRAGWMLVSGKNQDTKENEGGL